MDKELLEKLLPLRNRIDAIDEQILRQALEQAREGRMHILGKMMQTLDHVKPELSKYAPKIVSFDISPDKIGDVVGKSGKTINQIIAETGVKIDISEEGNVVISSIDSAQNERAKHIIQSITEDLVVNNEYTGKVVKIMQFGAFVEISPTKDGMIHISKLSDKHIEKVEDVVKIGDNVKVKVLKVDEKGRVDLKLVEVIK